MKIPAATPLHGSPMQAGVAGSANEDASSDRNRSNLIYHGYYGGASGNSSVTDAPDAPAQQQQYYHGGASTPPHHPQGENDQHRHQQHLGMAYYDHYRTAQTIYDATYDQQCTDRVEEQYDHQSSPYHYNQTSSNHPAHYEEFPFQDENAQFYDVGAASSPATAMKDKLLPSVFSLAQKLMPTVLKRLENQRGRLINSQGIVYEDDFEGTCSPLGSPNSTIKQSISIASFTQARRGSSGSDENEGNLKTTGLEESDYYYADRRGDVTAAKLDDLETGGESMEDPMKYLPQSAALLVSALQKSAVKSKGRANDGDGGNDNESGIDAGGFSKSPILSRVLLDLGGSNHSAGSSLNNSFHISNTSDSADESSSPLRRSNTIESTEREADKLLESIRRDDYGGKKRRGSDASQDGDVVSRAIAAAIGGGASSAVDDDDDEGSIGGDMARLTNSIAHLQRDLESIDFDSMMYDDGFGGVGSNLEGYDGENSMLARLKLWFSRGMIMEQKLLNTYVNPMDDGDGTGARTEGASSGYADNPVLVWSLALLWAFVVVILMHPKIAELVEQGSNDPGQLADIVEWLFG